MNPLSDVAFAGLANDLVQSSATPDELQMALRVHHPDAVVHRRGLSGEPELWYVYRDGHWVPSTPGTSGGRR